MCAGAGGAEGPPPRGQGDLAGLRQLAEGFVQGGIDLLFPEHGLQRLGFVPGGEGQQLGRGQRRRAGGEGVQIQEGPGGQTGAQRVQ